MDFEEFTVEDFIRNLEIYKFFHARIFFLSQVTDEQRVSSDPVRVAALLS
jgi:hypothetical protein